MSRPESSVRPLEVGFFGKLPSYGDFVERSLPAGFVATFDDWLQRALVASRGQLGNRWQEAYLSSAIWRFILQPGVADGSAWSGILMPSVDRVGRYYPFCMAMQWSGDISAFAHAVSADAWFASAEVEALAALDASSLDLDNLAGRLRDLSARQQNDPGVIQVSDSWRGSVDAGGSLAGVWMNTLDAEARLALGSYSLWWAGGAKGQPARWMACGGWPEAAEYAGMLGSGAMPFEDDPLAITLTRMERISSEAACRSAAVCDQGLVREENQDAWGAVEGLGCWIVADGMGGHAEGARASALVIESVREHAEKAKPEHDHVESVRAAIGRANERLGEEVAQDPDGFDGGATVVALVLRNGTGSVLWAGDSRAYRWRAGAFEQLTRDHVDHDDPFRDPHEITTAVAGREDFELEERRIVVEAEDRFLLCSDGVHGVVPEDALATLVGTARDAEAACAAIGRAVRAGGAPDNYTAVVVVA